VPHDNDYPEIVYKVGDAGAGGAGGAGAGHEGLHLPPAVYPVHNVLSF